LAQYKVNNDQLIRSRDENTVQLAQSNERLAEDARVQLKEIQRLTALVKTLESAVEKKDAEIVESKLKVKETSHLVSQSNVQLAENLQQKSDELTRLLATKKQLEATLAQKDVEINRSKRSEATLADLLKQKEQQLLKLKQSHDEAMRESEERSSNEMSTLHMSLLDAERSISQNKEEIASLTAKLQKKNTSESGALVESESGENALKALETEAKSLRELMRVSNELKSENEKLKEQMKKIDSDSSKEMNAMKHQLKETSLNLSKVTVELTELKDIQEEKVELEGEVSRLMGELRQLRRDREESVSSLSHLYEQLQLSKKVSHGLEAELREKNQHMEQLSIQYGSVIEELAMLKLGTPNNGTISAAAASVVVKDDKKEKSNAVEVSNTSSLEALPAVADDSAFNVLNWFR